MSRPLAPLLAAVAAASISSSVSAQTDLTIEFNEDDQSGFDIWPVPLSGSYMIAQFGAVTVEVTTNTGFAHPTNRGSTDGNPPGYTYQHLYEDLLHAFTPTGTLTLDFSGLLPDEPYTFTLYAWDPGTSAGTHEWTITGGTGVPSVATVDWSAPLVDNHTFALVFEVTTTASGTFQVDNTAGLAGSAINGFELKSASGSIGTSYCGPSNTNSTNMSAVITAFGSEVVAKNDVTLSAALLPPNQFGYYLTSTDQGFIPFPGGSQGNLCLQNQIGRFNRAGEIQSSGAGGMFDMAIDLTDIPTPTGTTSVVAGETWNFTAWYRDVNPTQTSNFTDGVSILFQ